MKVSQNHTLLASLVCLVFLLEACSPAAANESAIATGVALTVAAQDTERADYTATPAPATATATKAVTLTPLATTAPPTAPTGSAYCNASASYVADATIPDGTIVSPGQVFTKTWRIQNTGTCPWYKTWKWVYTSGDLMGGATVYDFPQVAQPGDIVDVPIVLTAPLTAGESIGYWKIQSPWGYLFGDEGSGNAFSVDVVVGSGTPENAKTATVYGITNVSYTITRECTTANTRWHISVNLTSNGPVDVIFNVIQSDGNGKRKINMSFTSATTQTYDYGEWTQRFTSSTNPRWVQAIVTSPGYFEWPHSQLMYLCGY
jgi:hypothetical protein